MFGGEKKTVYSPNSKLLKMIETVTALLNSLEVIIYHKKVLELKWKERKKIRNKNLVHY